MARAIADFMVGGSVRRASAFEPGRIQHLPGLRGGAFHLARNSRARTQAGISSRNPVSPSTHIRQATADCLRTLRAPASLCLKITLLRFAARFRFPRTVA